jgi:hypothetical protein
LIHPE